ncbi:hypothetical protein [Mesorhizobium sp. dw_380]|uniref:hypothetical protein n=1 Tax=Mesorhizobium sp. dw_380 TaxID=2812001 RepID=UPI001BDF441F|nr:hypothetical protein [Mesorhizobium sp. dw_380]
MKPISDTAINGRGKEEPVRLLALGLFGRETPLNVGAVIGLAASAIHLLQDNLAKPCESTDENGRRSTRLAGDAATLDGFAEPNISSARVINVAAILTRAERISLWGHDIAFELEIEKGLSAAIYERDEFRSAFLGLVADVQVALAQGGQFMMSVERADGSRREHHQEITRDSCREENCDLLDDLDAGRAFAELLSLTEVTRDGRPEIAVALDFALYRHRLIESEAPGARQCVVMRLRRLWLMHGSTTTRSCYQQLNAVPPRESIFRSWRL